MSDKIFVDGMFAKKRECSPAFIITSLSIKVPELIPFLEKNQNNAGYVNIDILLSQKGTQYCQLNTFKPTQDKVKMEEDNQEILNNLPKSETVIDPSDGRELNPDIIPF